MQHVEFAQRVAHEVVGKTVTGTERHIAVLQAMTLVSLYLAGRIIGLRYWFDAGLGAAAVFFIYQLWLIRTRERAACFQAFQNNQYVGMSVFIGIALEYLFAR